MTYKNKAILSLLISRDRWICGLFSLSISR